ncbi:MAG: hypothetical protein NVS3B17_09470 [Vulcanimicrobiaceae bacterium]
MLFEVVRVRELRDLGRPHPYAVIILTAPRARRIALRPDAARVATIWRMFDDVGHAYDDARDARASYCTASDADALLDFIEPLRVTISTCVVACEEGEGRSRGVALALALAYGDATHHLAQGRPNTHVVRTLLERFAERTGSALALPCIVRYSRRCPQHVRREIPPDVATSGICDVCDSKLEPVPIDIVTGGAIARAHPSRAFAAT